MTNRGGNSNDKLFPERCADEHAVLNSRRLEPNGIKHERLYEHFPSHSDTHDLTPPLAASAIKSDGALNSSKSGDFQTGK